MALVFESRASDSPYLHHVGSLKASRDSVFSVVPDGSWGLVVYRTPQQTNVYLTGSTTRPIPVHIRAGDEILSVSFKPSAYSPRLSAANLLNNALLLPAADGRSIWWSQYERVELPTLDNAEDFVAALVEREHLAQNKAVDAILQGHSLPMSPRSLQRHFLKTTGMTHNYWEQIQRAQKAAAALHSGKSLAQVAFEAGYADQPHMTRWLKQIIGRTPAEIARTEDTSSTTDPRS
jgi:AraC-like DNA-binding protein